MPKSDPVDPNRPSDPTAKRAMDALVDRWLDEEKSRYLPRTIDSYGRAVRAFGAFLRDQGKSWEECDANDLKRYFAQRLENDLSARSAKQRLSAIGAFFAFAQKRWGFVDVSRGYRLRGKSDPLPTLLDVEVLARLLDQAPPCDPRQERLWRRDKAMFELLYGSGLRVSELVGLNVEDVDAHERLVRAMGKGAKPRIAPMGKKSAQAILAYLPLQAAWGKGAKALFVSERGGRLCVRSVQQRLLFWAKRANIDRRLHPHLLRHAFASHLLSSSRDLRSVQEMLGHSDMRSTQVYTHLDFAALACVYDSAHPRAQKNNQSENA